MCCFATFRVLLYSIIIGGENCARDTNIKEISSEREKKKGGTTHVAKFQQVDETRENLDLRARVHEFLRSLSLSTPLKNNTKTLFFGFFALMNFFKFCHQVLFLFVGSRYFFSFFLFKSSYKRDSQTLKNLLY